MENELPYAAMALVKNKLLSKELAATYYQEACNQNFTLIEYLVKLSLIDPRKIALVLADYFNLQFFDLDGYSISHDIIQLIPIDLLISYKILPLYLHASTLVIAISDPSDHLVTRDVKFYCEYAVVFVVSEMHKLSEKLHNFLYQKQLPVIDELSNPKRIDINGDEFVIKLVNTIVNNALIKGSSDVHIEPFDDCYRIRYRIDGILHKVSKMENELASRVCSRIKILANLNIVEHRLPQDGRFSFVLQSKKMIDCRVSICPVVNGEKIVIRFLNKINTDSLTIDALQMEERDRRVFLQALACSQGLILVTGPTGSGKSTTLYTALNYLNKEDVNIISVEDPVEMKISGINQIQVNTRNELDFAAILRAILRQDPDIIMIGEIRDLETAKIAIQAAETGHLVLASIHTNSAAQTINRLVNLGIPIYNLLSSLRLIIAQRLVRKLCIYCHTQTKNELDMVCIKCNSGYHERIGIFEIMSISPALTNHLSMHEFNINVLQELACKEGMQLIKNAGLNLVCRGITSLEELQRVVEI